MPSLSGTMCALNEDILRLIVDYLPEETLKKVNSAHSVFYEAWMKARFASIAVDKRDKDTKKLLAHLALPHVAQHVKKFGLKPWLVQPRTKSSLSRTENMIMRCMQVIDPDYTRKTAEQRLQKRLRKDTTRFTAAFAQMSRMQEYTINWDESDAFHPEFYRAFLVPPLEKWAGHLTALSIRVPLSMVNSLARLRLPHLETLTYHFCTGYAPLKDINDAHDGFVVFVNNLKDSLQNLTLTSTSTSQHLDLSRVFRMLGTFPSLKRVSLSVPFDGGHLSDPMTFAEFLIKHSGSLKEFSLTTSRCTAHSKPGDPDHINWIHHIIKAFKTPFPLLNSLGIALRPLKAPLDDLVNFLDMHSPTLRAVLLMDRALTMRDIEMLFATAPDCAENLQELHVKADGLSARLLVFLASRFPRLQTLHLECNSVEIDRARVMDAALRTKYVTFGTNLHAHQRALSDWTLQHLALGMPERVVDAVSPDLVRYLPRLAVSCFKPC